jgi:DNA (cytosine-5)-methyltransferase 1
MSQAFYNEIDPFAAAWLRELIKSGLIAPGVVDERSIEDICPTELLGYTQCHFFAGIGVWSHALRCAGWPDDRPVWTGSCPCQPFSAAGKRGGTADERHLWPAYFHLISQCKPVAVFGEQVASKDGLGWLDLVHADMAGAGYSFGVVDMCAAGLGAPHIRQRLWFVADADEGRRGEDGEREGLHGEVSGERADESLQITESSAVGYGGLAHPEPLGRRGRGDGDQAGNDGPVQVAGRSTVGPVADTEHDGHGRPDTDAPKPRGDRPGDGIPDGSNRGLRGASGLADPTSQQDHQEQQRPATHEGKRGTDGTCGRGMAVNGFWRNAVWLHCRDGKARPVEPGSFPLVDGAPARVGRLRGYGNAIVAPVAEAWIKAYMDETFQAL